MSPRFVGLRYRLALWPWLSARTTHGPFDQVELDADDAARGPDAWLSQLAEQFSVTLRDDAWSLPGDEADESTVRELVRFARLVRARWITTPLGCRHAGTHATALPLPAALDDASLQRALERARRFADEAGCPVLIRNVASPLRVSVPTAETAWINRFCEASGSGIAVDLAALDLDARTHGYTAESWLYDVEARHVRELQLGGADDEETWLGIRRLPPSGRLIDLARLALARAPVQSVVVQCTAGTPRVARILDGLDRLGLSARG